MPTTSSIWIHGLLQTLAARNVDTTALLTDAGIVPAALESDEYRIPSDTVSELWRFAVDRLGDPALGVRLASSAKPAQYGVVGYAMMSSPDLRTSIERFIRYLRLISDAVAITLEETPDGARVTISFARGIRPVPRQRREYGLLMMLSLCRWILGGSLNPVAATFAGPRPDDLSAYEAVLRCPLTFGAQSDSFTVDPDDLANALPTSMPSLFSLHERIARLSLERLKKSDVARRVQEAVAKRLQDGTPLRTQIALDLHISDHTLQRRLGEAKTSFDALVADTRRELASQLLADENVSFVDIAFTLGYADQRSFFRPCARWFGRTPGEMRAENRNGAANTMAATDRVG